MSESEKTAGSSNCQVSSDDNTNAIVLCSNELQDPSTIQTNYFKSPEETEICSINTSGKQMQTENQIIISAETEAEFRVEFDPNFNTSGQLLTEPKPEDL